MISSSDCQGDRERGDVDDVGSWRGDVGTDVGTWVAAEPCLGALAGTHSG